MSSFLTRQSSSEPDGPGARDGSGAPDAPAPVHDGSAGGAGASVPAPAACTVYHDESCPLCRAEIALYKRLAPDRPVAFVDVSVADPNEAVGEGLTGAQAMRRFHVRGPDGRLHSGAAAFGVLWRQYPQFRWLGRLMRLAPVRWIAEGAYRVFLVTVRPALQWYVRRRTGCGCP